MKKILMFMMLLVSVFTLVACTEVSNTLAITQAPPTEYVVGFKGDVVFKFKADNDEYTVTWTNGGYTYKKGGTDVDQSLVEVAGISITPMDFTTEGSKTVVIKYNQVSAQFQYVVKPVDAPVGDGSAANPFRIYTGQELVTKIKAVEVTDNPLVDAAKAVTYFKLEADLDLSGINEELEIRTAYIQIDGAKALGGNYKISNLNQTLFSHIYFSTLRNIDIVDAVTKEHIVGAEGYGMTIDNVNILGNSFTSEAAYFDNLHGNSTISNSKNYATVIDRGGTAAGFIRRVDNDRIPNSVLTITNSFNHGKIQSANLSARLGGLVSTSGTGKVVIRQSGNLGSVELYVSTAQKLLVESAVAANKGAFALVGHNITSASTDSQSWAFEEDYKNFVDIDEVSLQNAEANPIKVFNASFYEDMSAMQFLTNVATLVPNPTLAYYRVVVIGSGSNHAVVNNEFVSVAGGGGMMNIYDELVQEDDLAEIKVLSVDTLAQILANPYAKGITGTVKTPGGIFVDAALEGQYGYDAYDKGNYRVVGLKQTLTVQYYGYNAQNELVFVASGKVAVTATQTQPSA